MRVEPQHAARAVHPREACERPERDRVVAPEHERQLALRRRLRDHVRDTPAGLLDLPEEPRPLVAHRRGFGDRRFDVPAVDALVPEIGEPRVKARVADSRRTHVDAAAACSEIERCSDDGDPAFGFLQEHRGKANVRRC